MLFWLDLKVVFLVCTSKFIVITRFTLTTWSRCYLFVSEWNVCVTIFPKNLNRNISDCNNNHHFSSLISTFLKEILTHTYKTTQKNTQECLPTVIKWFNNCRVEVCVKYTLYFFFIKVKHKKNTLNFFILSACWLNEGCMMMMMTIRIIWYDYYLEAHTQSNDVMSLANNTDDNAWKRMSDDDYYMWFEFKCPWGVYNLSTCTNVCENKVNLSRLVQVVE